MTKKLALEAGICALSLPLAVFIAHRGHGRTLWIYVAFVAALAIIWVLQGLFRKRHLDGAKDERERFVAVLEIPPLASAETAVRVQIVKDAKASRC